MKIKVVGAPVVGGDFISEAAKQAWRNLELEAFDPDHLPPMLLEPKEEQQGKFFVRADTALTALNAKDPSAAQEYFKLLAAGPDEDITGFDFLAFRQDGCTIISSPANPTLATA